MWLNKEMIIRSLSCNAKKNLDYYINILCDDKRQSNPDIFNKTYEEVEE